MGREGYSGGRAARARGGLARGGAALAKITSPAASCRMRAARGLPESGICVCSACPTEKEGDAMTTVLDTKGLNCPLPVLKAKRALIRSSST